MTTPRAPHGALLPALLVLVLLLFIGILILTYLGASRANPVILDEQGRPRQPAPRSSTPP